MKRSILTFAALSCISVVVAAQAQQQTPPPVQAVQPAQTPDAAPPVKLILREGTDVKLKFAQDLSSKTAQEGDPVNLVLDEDLKVGDVVVVKAGAKALGTVTNSKRAGMMGKGGELNMRLEYIVVNNTRMRLRGSKGRAGEGKEGDAVALTVLFGPLGLIKHGKEVIIKEGTAIGAFVDEDFTVPVTK